ncbi:no significant blast hit [Histoplasma capsulatum var. duboisii H88]|uniref:No significant blast hit n=1 Tax=Ajellomyces capsulatus (strain H88) TaxID=544711 RepID=A0A8A1LTN3_AJEC8|nr:no significant blast hit [Histoplasma capsulatum var. duboisii H88]
MITRFPFQDWGRCFPVKDSPHQLTRSNSFSTLLRKCCWCGALQNTNGRSARSTSHTDESSSNKIHSCSNPCPLLFRLECTVMEIFSRLATQFCFHLFLKKKYGLKL